MTLAESRLQRQSKQSGVNYSRAADGYPRASCHNGASSSHVDIFIYKLSNQRGKTNVSSLV